VEIRRQQRYRRNVPGEYHEVQERREHLEVVAEAADSDQGPERDEDGEARKHQRHHHLVRRRKLVVIKLVQHVPGYADQDESEYVLEDADEPYGDAPACLCEECHFSPYVCEPKLAGVEEKQIKFVSSRETVTKPKVVRSGMKERKKEKLNGALQVARSWAEEKNGCTHSGEAGKEASDISYRDHINQWCLPDRKEYRKRRETMPGENS